MKACCRDEAARSLARHRDVATCDTCHALLLAYGNAKDYESTVKELRSHNVAFETAEIGGLRVIAKPAVRKV